MTNIHTLLAPYATSPYELGLTWLGVMMVVGCWAFLTIKLVEMYA